MKFLNVQEKADPIEKFTDKKIQSLRINRILADYYSKIENNEKKADKIFNCSSYLLFRSYFDPENIKKLVSANFCMHPLCLMCAWRLHVKKFYMLHEALSMLQADEPDIKLYFLNLTVKNWDSISKSKLRDLQTRAVRFIRKTLGVDSYYCSTEITISRRYKNYHPHLHCILATSEELGTMMQEIDILRKVWAKAYGEDEYDFLELTLYPMRENSINEVTKYILKPEQKITHDKIVSVAIAITGLKKTFSAGKIRRYIGMVNEGIKRENDTLIVELERFGFKEEFYKWVGNQYLLKSLEE